MIHKVRRYAVTLTNRGDDSGDLEVLYRPLVERVIQNDRDLGEAARALKLMLLNGVKSLVVAFEPERTRPSKHNMVISST